MDIISLSFDNLFSRHAVDKEGEKDLDVAAAVPTILADADAQRAEANEAEVVDDAVRVDAQAQDEDLPITPVTGVGDKEDDDDDDDDDESPSLPDAGKDLGGDDNEDDDDDDFTI
ncbi:pheromone-processing carboxypeptidase KEX1-like [Cynara cardunculus var. scolymus]|uniref:pheromone-processing carboxypeptidase KEX1-like n=1 Tax=Cynara cardunculus var. scolymus TaxID=59895 RepID=UPI000D623C5C|nr:pheromone-processing carboxypeptidase KEX1-like [Cynara cardunculus var. scolymus]